MRKTLLLLFGLLLALPAFARDFAYTYEGQTLTYTVIDEGAKTCEVGRNTNNEVSGVVVIPDIAMDGETEYSVISIGKSAFNSCSGLTSVTIGNSVQTIGDKAFFYCYDLTSVTIGNSVQTIGKLAFSDCSALKEVIIPDSVTEIGSEAFMGCDGLTSVTIGNSVQTIGDEAFSYCYGLTSVTIGNSVQTIGKSAFSGCYCLKEVSIGSSVHTIGDYAFYCCEGLKEVIIPDSVTEIGSYAFSNCIGLTSVTIGNSVTEIGKQAFSDCIGLTTLTIGESVTTIGDKAFKDCSSLNMITYLSSVFPDCNSSFYNDIPSDATFRVPYININKFYSSCPSPTFKVEVINPVSAGEPGYCFKYTDNNQTLMYEIVDSEAKTCRMIGFGAGNFGDMLSLPSQVQSDGTKYTVTSIGENAFTPVPEYAFSGQVELPSSIKTIEPYAFYNCNQIYGIFMSEGLEEIGEGAFSGCSLLENHTLPTTLKKIGDRAYYRCNALTEVVLPEGLDSLGDGVFSYCSNLERAVLVADIDTIGAELFNSCLKLDKVYLPLELKVIKDEAFLDCTSLEEILFPATLDSIGGSAFARCGLSKVTIPNNITSLGEGAFYGNKIKELTLGKGLVTVPAGAFAYNDIRVINFSEGLKEIGERAFCDNENMASIVLPSTLTTIGAGAFLDSNISALTIPDVVTELPSWSCGSPAVLNIGSGVRSMANDAFSFKNLRVLRVKSNTPPSLSGAFNIYTDQDALTMIVNDGRSSAYKSNARWKQIENIIEESSSDIVVYMTGDYPLSEEIRMTTGLMPSCVTKMKVVGPLTQTDLRIINENMVSLLSLDLSEATNIIEIPSNQFSGSLLTYINLPRYITNIGANAFRDCQLLEIENLPAGLESIGNNAFRNSPLIKLNTLPERLNNIGANAFSGCIGIQEIIGNDNLEGIGSGAFSGCSLLERVDLRKTLLAEVASETFSGCGMLDEVLLPETVSSIGSQAFSGTAIRDIAFISNVRVIGTGAFRGCRRLVTATMPEKIKNVPSGLFYNCPRLITSSMSSETVSVGDNLFNGSRKFANLSCAAINAPAAESGAFDGIRIRYASLIVPAMSFRSYLNAPQWGKFQSIQNRIAVTIEEGIDVTEVNEEEYQEMLTEDKLEEEAEKASMNEDEPESPDPEEKENIISRKARRAAARAATQEGRNSFAALFDGAQIQTSSDTKYIRIFINPKEEVKVTSILVNGEEKIGSLEGNSLVIPADKSGTLKICTNRFQSSVDEVMNDFDREKAMEVYNFNGVKVATSVEGLAPGFYIVRQGSKVAKIAVK
ncbi:MAG: leucine-rich repeat domain-containing protein [Muribaculaceae bacterium]|nr:leucine-rich repeat domain-containing protein [Muribaculaceae bacterium]